MERIEKERIANSHKRGRQVDSGHPNFATNGIVTSLFFD
jgi:hypothetical protein